MPACLECACLDVAGGPGPCRPGQPACPSSLPPPPGRSVAPLDLRDFALPEGSSGAGGSPYIAVGTASPFGEDYPCLGRVLLFQARLHLVWLVVARVPTAGLPTAGLPMHCLSAHALGTEIVSMVTVAIATAPDAGMSYICDSALPPPSPPHPTIGGAADTVSPGGWQRDGH